MLKIVISLVVIMAVGYTVISISSSMLNNSKEKVEDIGKLNVEDKIIEKISFDDQEINYLVEKCYEDNYMLKKQNLCFILKADSSIAINALTSLPAYVDVTGSNAKTIYVSYDNERVSLSD